MTDQLVQPRARQLPAAAPSEQRDKYLTFTLGHETFAMEIRFIREIIQHSSLTEVPLMPAFIRGVLNLRGAVVPVVDLAVRFDRPPTEVGKRTCVVILEVQRGDGSFVLGTLVDNVSEVLEIAEGDIEATPVFGSSLRSEFIRGVGKVGGRFVILLDVGHVLSLDEMAEMCASKAG